MKRARDSAALREALTVRELTFTHRELARLAGCSVGTIGFILDGQPTDPARARRIARALRRAVDDLFQDVVSSGEQTDVEP